MAINQRRKKRVKKGQRNKGKGSKITVDIVDYQNKSRQGTYVKIKSTKGPIRVYKIRPGEPIDPSVEHYKSKYLTKKEVKGLTLQKRRKAYTILQQPKSKRIYPKKDTILKRYITQLKKRPRLEKFLKGGISTVKILNPHKTNRATIIKARRQLLEPIVLDKGIREILVQDENFKKIAKRLDYELIIQNEYGDQSLGAFKQGENLDQIIQQVKRAMHGQTEITEEKYDREGTIKGGVVRTLQTQGWNVQNTTKGKITDTYLYITFRKK